jgi:hypothetical protein
MCLAYFTGRFIDTLCYNGALSELRLELIFKALLYGLYRKKLG